ncbi:MAG TPA: hypothetical protein VLY63_17020 [Anaerolineae bacterium]|nr:hypothetical protein [Anaerolineae bacterium]
MRNRKLWVILIGAFLVLLISASTLAAAPMFKKAPSITDEMVIWELTKTTVVDAGQTKTDAMGTFTEGYTIEAKAKAKHNNVVPEGRLWLTLTAFSPAEDMPGQEAGFWYVQGKWRITKKDADPEALKVRHNPEVIEGSLQAKLDFNPATGQGNWTGVASLPMSLAAGNWGRGEGTLTFDENLEGDLFLPLEIWSKDK